MAYKIDYGMGAPVIHTTKRVKKRKGGNAKRWVASTLLIALLIGFAITDVWIPGDATITKEAMSNFISDIKGGEQVVEAFAAFCQTVLQGG